MSKTINYTIPIDGSVFEILHFVDQFHRSLTCLSNCLDTSEDAWGRGRT
jgi:hypothetical protein